MSTNKRIVSIVDDDVYIAQLFHEALSENIDGISVFSFNDPIMAFQHFTENKENYALVISDLRMAGLNGLELLKKVKDSNPKVRTILMSAYNFEEEELYQSYMTEAVINSTIEKPVTMNRLCERVRDELNASQSSHQKWLSYIKENFTSQLYRNKNIILSTNTSDCQVFGRRDWNPACTRVLLTWYLAFPSEERLNIATNTWLGNDIAWLRLANRGSYCHDIYNWNEKYPRLTNNTINYAKLNRVRLRDGMRENASTTFREFFASIHGKVSGLKGYTILENSDDNNETLVLTFWGSKPDMDNYYSNGNSSLSSLVEEVKPMFEKMPERITYNVVSLDVTKWSKNSGLIHPLRARS